MFLAVDAGASLAAKEPEELVIPVEAESELLPPPLATPKELLTPSPPSPVLPAHLDVWENSPMSPKTPIAAEDQVLKSFVDESRTRDVFRSFAEGGEIDRLYLEEALRMMGHETVNTEWVSAIIKDKRPDRDPRLVCVFSSFFI